MRSRSTFGWRTLTSEDGASTLEYAVLIGLLVVAALGGIAVLGGNIQSTAGKATTTWTTSTESEPSGGTAPSFAVFTDAFDRPNAAARWNFSGPEWRIATGTLQVGPVAGWKELRSYIHGSEFRAGTIALDATLRQGSGFGVLFRLSADPVKKNFDGYSFQYHPGYGSGAFLLKKYINGVEIERPLAIGYPDTNYEWLGVKRHIEVTTQGAQITAKVDGKTVISTQDSSYAEGGVGLRLWNNPDAQFDNLTVTATSR